MIHTESGPVPSTGSQFQQYRRLLARYLKPQRRRVAWMGVLLLTGIALQLANPQVIRFFLDTAQAGGPDRALFLAAALFIAFALLQHGMALLAGYVSQQVSWSATNRLRSDLALHCLRLDMDFHKARSPGELIDRIDGDVTQLANFLSQFVIQVLGNGLLVLGILALLFLEDAWVGAGMAVYTAVSLIVLGYIQKLAVPRWAAARQAIAEQWGFLYESITSVEDIRAVGAEPYLMRRLFGLMRNFLEKTRAGYVISSLTYNLTNLMYVLGYAAGLALGVYLYTSGQATIGAAYLTVYYVGMLAGPLQGIRAQVEDLQQAAASIGRVEELFSLQPSVREPEDRPAGQREEDSPADLTELPSGPLAVAFHQVSFRYNDGENVLNNVSFDLPPGQVLGILGRTGSGKSTLTRLLFRLYDPDRGSIRLDGADLRSLPISEVRRRAGMVTQDVQLFQASVRDNLTFFNPRISDERLERVLSELGLWEWVQSLPEGLATRLASGGQGLSAGEAQLLAFGRVFLKDPGLVILDEASSRLDPVTETRLERAVDLLFEGRTGVIIAHRLKTVLRADAILILEEGRAVEYGPRQLLAADPESRFYSLLRTGLEEALA